MRLNSTIPTRAASKYVTPKYTVLFPEITQISMSAVGHPKQNGNVKRFMRTFKEEHVGYTEYRDFADELTQIACWMEVEYLNRRITFAGIISI